LLIAKQSQVEKTSINNFFSYCFDFYLPLVVRLLVWPPRETDTAEKDDGPWSATQQHDELPSLYCSSPPARRCPARLRTHTRVAASRLESLFQAHSFFSSPLRYADSGRSHSHYNSTPYAKSSTGAEQLLLPVPGSLSLLPRTRPKNPRNPRKGATKTGGGLQEEEQVSRRRWC
jgi:hypothetical protein